MGDSFELPGIKLNIPVVGGINQQAEAAARADGAVQTARDILGEVHHASQARIDHHANEARAVIRDCRDTLLGALDLKADALALVRDEILHRVLAHLDRSVEFAGSHLVGLYRSENPPVSDLTQEQLIDRALAGAGLRGPIGTPGNPIPPSFNIPPDNPPPDTPSGPIVILPSPPPTGLPVGEPFNPPVTLPPSQPPMPPSQPPGPPMQPPIVGDKCCPPGSYYHPEVSTLPGAPCWMPALTNKEGNPLLSGSEAFAAGCSDPTIKSVGNNLCASFINIKSLDSTECPDDNGDGGDNGAGGGKGKCEPDCPEGSHLVNPLEGWGDPVDPDEPLCGIADPANWSLGEDEFVYCGPPPETPEGCGDNGEPGDDDGDIDTPIFVEPPDNGEEPPSGPPVEFRYSRSPASPPIDDDTGEQPEEPIEEPEEPESEIPDWAQPLESCPPLPTPGVPSIPNPAPPTTTQPCDPANWQTTKREFEQQFAYELDEAVEIQMRWSWGQIKKAIDELKLGWLTAALFSMLGGAVYMLNMVLFVFRRTSVQLLPHWCRPNPRADFYSSSLLLATSTESIMSLATPAEKMSLAHMVNYSCQTQILSSAGATACRLSGQLNKDEWEYALKLNGDCIPWFQRDYDARKPKIGFRDALGFRNAEMITYEQFQSIAARHGFESTDDLTLFEKSEEQIPSATQALQWANDGIPDDELAEQFGLDEGFDDAWAGFMGEYAKRQLMPEYVAKMHWRAQNRRDVNIGSVKQAYVHGTITEGELGAWFNRFGLSSKDTETMIDLWRRSTVNQRARAKGLLTQVQLFRLASRSAITPDQYEQELLQIGWPENEAAQSKEKLNLFIEANERKDAIKEVRAAYKGGEIKDEEYYNKLIDAGCAPGQAFLFVTQDQKRKPYKQKEVGLSQLCGWVQRGYITPEQYIERAENLGYPPNDAINLALDCVADINEKRQKELEAQLRKLLSEAEKAASKSAKLQREERARFLRQLPFRLRPRPQATEFIEVPDGYGGKSIS